MIPFAHTLLRAGLRRHLLAGAVLFAPFLLYAQDPAQELLLARKFLLANDPYGALYTLKRYLFLYPEAASDPEFLMLMGVASSFSQNFRLAEENLLKAKALAPRGSHLNALIHLELAENLFLQGAMERAWQEYMGAATLFSEGKLRSYSFYKAGWAALLSGDQEGARYGFSLGAEETGIPLTTITFHLHHLAHLPRKSPELALGLSLIPGLGQMYVGNYGDGWSAFAVNLLFGGATYFLAREKQYPLAILVGAVGLVWYSGNLYAAWDGAKRYNETLYQSALERMKEETLLHYNPADPQRILFLRYGVEFR